MNNELIHRHLKSIMAMRGISQAEIARQLTKKLHRPMSRQNLNHVFRGRNRTPYIREAICEILGIDSKDLWE